MWSSLVETTLPSKAKSHDVATKIGFPFWGLLYTAESFLWRRKQTDEASGEGQSLLAVLDWLFPLPNKLFTHCGYQFSCQTSRWMMIYDWPGSFTAYLFPTSSCVHVRQAAEFTHLSKTHISFVLILEEED